MKKYMITLMALPVCAAAFSQQFIVSSGDLGENFEHAFYAKSFGCTGNNISPQIGWASAPAKTKAFAITMFDGDARAGRGFWHWGAYNIPADSAGLATNAGDPLSGLMPGGAVQLQNDGGSLGYIGPCPPHGERHLYRITVYALKKPVKIPKGATMAQAAEIFKKNSFAEAAITSRAQRPPESK